VAAALRSVPGVTDVEVQWERGCGVIDHAATVPVAALIAVVEAASAGTPHHYRARARGGEQM